MDQSIVTALLRPEAYPDSTQSVEAHQTHISYLFFTDAYVYKIKKPVDFGFLNFTTLDRRRFYCNEEVRLNSRLCPEMYLEVVELNETADGPSFKARGPVIDYAVKMKRLPADRMLDKLLAARAVTENDIRRIAREIAAFHQAAERNPTISMYGKPRVIWQNWEENFQQIYSAKMVPKFISQASLNLIREWIITFLSEKENLFNQRVADDFIRDCDGDIHSENICLTEKICIFDCIEFNSRFRYSDTAADIAFLLMDLDFNNCRHLSAILLDEYCRVTGDFKCTKLIDFYKVYRAFIRGKVEGFAATSNDIDSHDKSAAIVKAERYFRLARGEVVSQNLPVTLFLMSGYMGSGKSTFAQELSFELGITILSSDVVRKENAGVSPLEPRYESYQQGIYSIENTKLTYHMLREHAAKLLKNGQSVIVDASFSNAIYREEFKLLASQEKAQLLILNTVLTDDELIIRLTSREQEGRSVSDGRMEILDLQRKAFDPFSTVESLLRLDTSEQPGKLMETVYNSLGII